MFIVYLIIDTHVVHINHEVLTLIQHNMLRATLTSDGRYNIFSDGRVWSNHSETFIKPWIGSVGYLQLRLSGHMHLQHRIIANTFIPNPYNHPVVNHIDGNKLNNNVTNLEGCTYSYNNQHAWDIGLEKRKLIPY